MTELAGYFTDLLQLIAYMPVDYLIKTLAHCTYDSSDCASILSEQSHQIVVASICNSNSVFLFLVFGENRTRKNPIPINSNSWRMRENGSEVAAKLPTQCVQ